MPKCSRMDCQNEEQGFVHRDIQENRYCHRCSIRINRANNDELVTKPTPEDKTAVINRTKEGSMSIAQAVMLLKETDRGRKAKEHLCAMFLDGAMSLDDNGKKAIMTLIAGAFGDFPGTVLELISE